MFAFLSRSIKRDIPSRRGELGQPLFPPDDLPRSGNNQVTRGTIRCRSGSSSDRSNCDWTEAGIGCAKRMRSVRWPGCDRGHDAVGAGASKGSSASRLTQFTAPNYSPDALSPERNQENLTNRSQPSGVALPWTRDKVKPVFKPCSTAGYYEDRRSCSTRFGPPYHPDFSSLR